MAPRFTSPPDKMAFNIQVWDIVRKIPRGKVATYGQIAKMVKSPGVDQESYRVFGARWVGGAMAACPDDVPWQRVINAQGKVSSRRSGGEALQRQMLESEGVVFDDRQKVDFSIYKWSGILED